jgi:serine protease inhibitor ecotin
MGKLEKSGHRSTKMVSWKTDVVVSKSQLVEDCNSLRLYHNAERTADKGWGALPFLLFTMSSPARF